MKETQKSKITRVGWFLYDPKRKMLCLHRRDHKAKSPNIWDCFGGKIEHGEEPEEALIREVFEELGIEIEHKDMRLIRVEGNQETYRILFPIWKTPAIRLGEGAGFAWLPFDPSDQSSVQDKLKFNVLHKEALETLEKFQTTF